MLRLKDDSSPADVRFDTDAVAMWISFLLRVIFGDVLAESRAGLAASPGALRQRGSITIDTRDANDFSLGTRTIFAANRTISRLSFFFFLNTVNYFGSSK